MGSLLLCLKRATSSRASDRAASATLLTPRGRRPLRIARASYTQLNLGTTSPSLALLPTPIPPAHPVRPFSPFRPPPAYARRTTRLPAPPPPGTSVSRRTRARVRARADRAGLSPSVPAPRPVPSFLLLPAIFVCPASCSIRSSTRSPLHAPSTPRSSRWPRSPKSLQRPTSTTTSSSVEVRPSPQRAVRHRQRAPGRN